MDELQWFCQLRNDFGEDLYNVIKSKWLIEKYPCNSELKEAKGEIFFVILSGRVGVYLKDGESFTMISIYKQNQTIGQFSIPPYQIKGLVYVCLTKCILATLRIHQYQTYLQRWNTQKIDYQIRQLERINIFEPLRRQGKLILLSCMKETKFVKKQIIFRQGQLAKRIFWAKQGQVRLTVKSQDKQVNLSIIGENEIFGDVLEQEQYSQTAECDSQKALLFAISKKNLLKIIATFRAEEVSDLMKLNVLQKTQLRSKLKQQHSQSFCDTYECDAKDNTQYESTRTIHFSNNVYLSDKILVNTNRKIMQTILSRNQSKRPVINIRIHQRKPLLSHGVNLRQLSLQK